MVDRAREIARISAIREHEICIPMEFYTSNGYEIADTFPMTSLSTADLRKAYRDACDKFGAIRIDCCYVGDKSTIGDKSPKITVLRRTRNAEHSYIAVYSE